MIEYKNGDLLNVTEGIILHGCNGQGVMGETYEYLRNRFTCGYSVVDERIVCAANKFEDGTIVLGVRHGCEIMLDSAKKMGYKNLLKTEQGFYTNWQRFVTREEAMVIAREQDQLFRPDGTHNPDVLYSECLY